MRNARTGSTHLLEALPAEVLRLLAEKGNALTAADLAAQLLGEEGTSAQWEEEIQKVLLEFRRVGLAEPQGD